MRHLLIITTSYPFGQAGTEAAGSFVEDFATAVARHCRVTVLAPGVGPENMDVSASCTVRRYTVPLLPLSRLNPLNPTHWRHIRAVMRAGWDTLAATAHADRPDHVLALWALPSGWWARRALRELAIPYSVWALGSDIWTLGRIPLVRSLLARILRDAAGCYADGYQLAADVERLAGRPCEFMPSSRRLPQAREREYTATPPYRFAYLGRWHVNKGVDLLIGALNSLVDGDWQRIQEVRIAGGGPLHSRVAEGVNHLRHGRRPVTLLGYLDRAQAAALIAWADYLVIPSRIESIPVVFSDAMQGGCPVIASPVGDLPLLISRYRAGLLAPAASVPGLRLALRAALDSVPTDFVAALPQARQAFDVDMIAAAFVNRLWSHQLSPQGR